MIWVGVCGLIDGCLDVDLCCWFLCCLGFSLLWLSCFVLVMIDDLGGLFHDNTAVCHAFSLCLFD